MGERLLDKMEALFNKKYGIFLIILWALTIISVSAFIIIPILWGNNENYHELFKIYATNAGWMLFVALMLWLTYLGDKQEKKKNGDKLDEFLDWRYRPMNPSKKSPKNGNISQGNETTEKTFTRHDLVEYIYGEKIDSSSSEYKTWGRVLRDAVADGKITSDGKNRSGGIKYKKK